MIKPDGEHTMDLSRLSVAELNEMQAEIAREITRRRKSEADSLVSEFRKRAAEIGLSVEDLVTGKTSQKRGKVAIKYRHPQDANLTWTGRGKRPRWVEAWIGGGGSLEQITI
ncbi:MAG: H-NS histone family protein [Rhodocyclaceae bacterium]|nr:H-NS histone family protein [Rhodocyclaceae bacterium]